MEGRWDLFRQSIEQIEIMIRQQLDMEPFYSPEVVQDLSWKDVQETRTYACMEDTNHTIQEMTKELSQSGTISSVEELVPKRSSQDANNVDESVRSVLEALTHYECLKVSENATKDEICKGYRSVLLAIHPDKMHQTLDEWKKKNAVMAFQMAKEAWMVLSNESSKWRYDNALKSKEQYEKTKPIPPRSRLDVPVELIHHLQSLLPVKEATRTSVVSKAWLNAWQTIHKLRFHFKGMRREKYYDLMLLALRRYRRYLLPIESFDLGLTISNKEIASLVLDWIHHVSNPEASLKELLLDISVSTDSSFTLPIMIFSSRTLKSITVTTDTRADVNLSFHSNPEMIQCVYLRVLDLEYVYISDDVVAKLLSVCSLLEKIRLFCCEGLKTVKVKNLFFLRELKIHLLDLDPIVTIINVPNLLKVDYFPLVLPIEKPPPFNMDSFGSVTQLVIANVLMDSEFFDTIKSKLLFLQSLTLRIGEWAQENFVISSVSLKKLDLQICISKQFVIGVCAPQLMSCVCECPEPAPSISFAAGNPKHLKVTTCFSQFYSS